MLRIKKYLKNFTKIILNTIMCLKLSFKNNSFCFQYFLYINLILSYLNNKNNKKNIRMNYNSLLEYYEKNKNRDLNEWLNFDGCLKSQGKQGIIGFLKIKDSFEPGNYVFYKKKKKIAKIVEIDKNDGSIFIEMEDEPKKIISTLKDFLEPIDKNNKYIFKISQYTNHLAYHEMICMQGLRKINSYCPHFCKGFGVIKGKVEPRFRKAVNPFEIKSKYPIEKEVLLCEYIDKSYKFYNYIKSDKIHENVLYSIIKQILLAITIAQKEKQFTHYDLHSNNIMIKKCNKDLVFLYKLDDENQFCVPSMGHIGIIIDYGFSYISDMKDGPLYASLCHTDVGFMSDRFDWVADPKLFLVTVSDEIKEMRKTKNAKKLRRIVRNMFAPLKIDWDSGWDNVEKKGAVDYVANVLETYNDNSRIFNEFDYYCLDLIQSLIILPIQQQNYDDIKKSYQTFLNEWIKIENEISSEFYNLYILKEMIDIARFVRPDYLKSETRSKAVSFFKNTIYDTLNKVSKFCIPKNLHFEKLLCSLYVLSKNIEGMLFEIISSQMETKNEQYEKLLLNSVEQIFATVDVNIQDEYKYNNNTQIMIIDNVLKKNDLFQIPSDEIENINNLSPLARGAYINDLYNISNKTITP